MRRFTRLTNKRTIEQAAITQVYCCLEPGLISIGGDIGGIGIGSAIGCSSNFYEDCKQVKLKGSGGDLAVCEELYDRTKKILKEFLIPV